MSKHNKCKEVFFKDMSMVISMMMIFIETSLHKTSLSSINCRKLNSYNVEFQFGIVKKIIEGKFFCCFTSFVVTT
jgi:hypothetical protein